MIGVTGEIAAGDMSVVVCTYDEKRRPLLERALEALEHQEQPPAAVIVVVDHNPRLFSLLRADHPQLTVVPNDRKRGLSGARNCGLALTVTPVVAFLDDDAVPEPDWVRRLALAYQAGDRQRVVGVGGAIVPSWAVGRPWWFPAEFDWVVGCTYKGAPTDPAPVRNMLGANMSFRTEELRRIGGFRDGIGRIGTVPLGCEETEACIRMVRQCPGSQILVRANRPCAPLCARRTRHVALPGAPVLGRGAFEGVCHRTRRALRRARQRAAIRDANTAEGGGSVVRRIPAPPAGGTAQPGSRRHGRAHSDNRGVRSRPMGQPRRADGPAGLGCPSCTIFGRSSGVTAMTKRPV